jgi:hypothetical protein
MIANTERSKAAEDYVAVAGIPVADQSRTGWNFREGQVVQPAHGGLDHTVKHWKVDGRAHGYTPPDQRLDIQEFNTQNGL